MEKNYYALLKKINLFKIVSLIFMNKNMNKKILLINTKKRQTMKLMENYKFYNYKKN